MLQNLINKILYTFEFLIFMPLLIHLYSDSEKSITDCTFSGRFDFCM